MAVFDVRTNDGVKIDKIVFAEAEYCSASTLRLGADNLVISDEDCNDLDLSYESIPNLILALQKAMEIHNKPATPVVVAKKTAKKK